MLNWRRILLVAALLAAARGIVAALSAGVPQGAEVVEALGQESGVGSQESGDGSSKQFTDSRDHRSAAVPATPDSPKAFTPSAEFQQWITNLVRQQLPE